jgi:hypothetical protein
MCPAGIIPLLKMVPIGSIRAFLKTKPRPTGATLPYNGDLTVRIYPFKTAGFLGALWGSLALVSKLLICCANGHVTVDLNGGMYMNNASNARLLTDLVLLEPQLLHNMPSIAEALAVYASSTLVAGSLSSTYSHTWPYDKDEHILPEPGLYESFTATYRTQQYISAPQPDLGMPLTIFYYAVLVLALVLSLVCVVYHVRNKMVTEFTDPQNMFSMATNSPPSRVLQVNSIPFLHLVTNIPSFIVILACRREADNS